MYKVRKDNNNYPYNVSHSAFCFNRYHTIIIGQRHNVHHGARAFQFRIPEPIAKLLIAIVFDQEQPGTLLEQPGTLQRYLFICINY